MDVGKFDGVSDVKKREKMNVGGVLGQWCDKVRDFEKGFGDYLG